MKALLISILIVTFGWFSLSPAFLDHAAKSQTAVQQLTNKVMLAKGQCYRGYLKGNNISCQ